MIKYVVVIISLLFCLGCDIKEEVEAQPVSHTTAIMDHADNNAPDILYSLKQPIYYVEANEGGLILQDSNGELVVLKPEYYLSAVLIKGNFKRGDVIDVVDTADSTHYDGDFMEAR